MHRGKQRGTHVWDGQARDAAAELAAPLGDDAAAVVELLAHPGEPAEVLAALTERLGVPEQAAAVLSGVPAAEVPGLVHKRPRGVREAIAAAARGESRSVPSAACGAPAPRSIEPPTPGDPRGI